MARGARHFVAAAAVAAAVAYTALYGHIHGLPHFQSDGYSYYVYLPSAFIYHDVTARGARRRLVRRPLSRSSPASAAGRPPAAG